MSLQMNSRCSRALCVTCSLSDVPFLLILSGAGLDEFECSGEVIKTYGVSEQSGDRTVPVLQLGEVIADARHWAHGCDIHDRTFFRSGYGLRLRRARRALRLCDVDT